MQLLIIPYFAISCNSSSIRAFNGLITNYGAKTGIRKSLHFTHKCTCISHTYKQNSKQTDLPNPVAASSSSHDSVNNFQLFTSGGQRRDQTAERQTLGLPKNICRTWTHPKRLPLFRKSRSKPNLESTSKYGFFPDLGGKNGGVLSMRMQVILDSISFPEPSLPLSSGTGKRRPLAYCVSARHFIGQQQSMRNFTGS